MDDLEFSPYKYLSLASFKVMMSKLVVKLKNQWWLNNHFSMFAMVYRTNKSHIPIQFFYDSECIK